MRWPRFLSGLTRVTSPAQGIVEMRALTDRQTHRQGLLTLYWYQSAGDRLSSAVPPWSTLVAGEAGPGWRHPGPHGGHCGSQVHRSGLDCQWHGHPVPVQH